MTDTTTLIAELREKLAKATPGPWEAREAPDGYFQDMNIIRPDGLAVACAVMNGDITRTETWDNASLIVAAINALPTILDTLESQRREIEWMREALEEAVALIRECRLADGAANRDPSCVGRWDRALHELCSAERRFRTDLKDHQP